MLIEAKQMNTFCLKQCSESWQEMKVDSVLHISDGTDSFFFLSEPSVSNTIARIAPVNIKCSNIQGLYTEAKELKAS